MLVLIYKGMFYKLINQKSVKKLACIKKKS